MTTKSERAPQVLDEVDERLAASAAERENTARYVAEGQVWKADTPERVEQRKDRLLTEPNMVPNLSVRQRSILANAPLSEAPEEVQQAFEAQIGGRDTQPCWFLTRGADVRRSVGRIAIRNAQRRTGWGTGFLVAPNLLVTNQHVLLSPATAEFSRIEFDYEETYDGDILPTATFDLDPQTLFLSDRAKNGLDYALVAVAPRPRADSERADAELVEFGYLPLIRDEGKLLNGEPINCVHHPEGQPRQLGIRGNRLMALLTPELEGTWLHYETDTEPGSSGSPLFNNQWEVVGIHHRSVEKRDDDGRILAIGGGLWSQEMGVRQIWWEANEGLRISSFVRHVEARVHARPRRPPTGQVVTDAGIALVERMLRPVASDGRPAPPPAPVRPTSNRPRSPEIEFHPE